MEDYVKSLQWQGISIFTSEFLLTAADCHAGIFYYLKLLFQITARTNEYRSY